MIGAIHRMRFIADAPQQKLLGCITDSIGTITLALSLMNLEKDCFRILETSDFVDPIDPSIVYPQMYFLRGGGYLIYWVFCFSGCLVRAVIHWLTPLPGMGVGAFNFKVRVCDVTRGAKRLRIHGDERSEEKEHDQGVSGGERSGCDYTGSSLRSVANTASTFVNTPARRSCLRSTSRGA
jgi:hypothetical protein